MHCELRWRALVVTVIRSWVWVPAPLQEYHVNPFWNLVGLNIGQGKVAKKISRFALMAIIGDVLDRKMDLLRAGDEVRGSAAGWWWCVTAVCASTT